MTVRVKAEEVKEIMNTNLSDPKISSFIVTANTLLNSAVTGLGADLLKEIERWLAAHLIVSTVERQAEMKKIGDATEKYASLGLNLQSTTYGQTAAILDTSGKLSDMGKKKVRFEVATSFDDSPVHDL
jgi:hypothetical protein